MQFEKEDKSVPFQRLANTIFPYFWITHMVKYEMGLLETHSVNQVGLRQTIMYVTCYFIGVRWFLKVKCVHKEITLNKESLEKSHFMNFSSPCFQSFTGKIHCPLKLGATKRTFEQKTSSLLLSPRMREKIKKIILLRFVQG